MRALPLVLAAVALLASACSNACQALGERLCECTLPGTTRSSCVDQIKAEVSRVNPNKDEQAACESYLSTCYAHDDPVTHQQIEFCPWIAGRCGKASCGLSGESYKILSGVDPNTQQPLTPDPDNPSQPLCPP